MRLSWRAGLVRPELVPTRGPPRGPDIHTNCGLVKDQADPSPRILKCATSWHFDHDPATLHHTASGRTDRVSTRRQIK